MYGRWFEVYYIDKNIDKNRYNYSVKVIKSEMKIITLLQSKNKKNEKGHTVLFKKRS